MSARRLAGVLHASGEVLAAACDVSFAEEGRLRLEAVAALRDALRRATRQLHYSDCPRDTLRSIETGLEAGPATPELRDRLIVPPPGRTPESAGRGKAPTGR